MISKEIGNIYRTRKLEGDDLDETVQGLSNIVSVTHINSQPE